MIHARGLARTYKTRRGDVDAVRGVDLDVDAGEIVGFLGPNGAGKTTTLRMLTTLLRPTRGEATVAGADLRRDPGAVRRRIGYVAQSGSTSGEARAGEEVVDHALLYGVERSVAITRGRVLFEQLELDGLWDRKCSSLSGGQRRRLDIVTGLIHTPRLVFLDEPTTGLDPQARANLWTHVRGLRDERGSTVFLTTHYLDEADALCDRILVIDHGQIVAQGSPEELKQRVSGDAVLLSAAQPADVARIAAVAAQLPGRGRPDRRRHPRRGPRPGGSHAPRRPPALARRRGHRAGRRRAASTHPRRRLPHPHRPVPARRREPGSRPNRRSRSMTTTATSPTFTDEQSGRSTFVRDALTVFRRAMRISLRNPVWAVMGLLQPVLYLSLFGPLLEPLAPQLGATNAYQLFVPGLLVQLGMFGALFVGFGLIGEWRDGVIEAERVSPAPGPRSSSDGCCATSSSSPCRASSSCPWRSCSGSRHRFWGIVLGIVTAALLAAAFASASYAVALTLKSEDALAPLMNGVALPLLLLSGILLPITAASAPAWLNTLSNLNPIKHVVSGIRAQFDGDIGSPTALWGSALTIVLAAVGLWFGSRTFKREDG